jgi:hypothetical protein
MAMGFDQLMKYLLEEIALNGEAGMLVSLFPLSVGGMECIFQERHEWV